MAIRPYGALAAVLALVVVLTALVGAGTVAAGSGSDSRAVASLLRKQAGLFNARQWQALWRTYTPRFRRGCSYRLWRNEQRALRRAIGARLAVRGVRVRVVRRRAHVSYTLVLGERGVVVVRPPHTDLYVKIGRRWYDEGDGITTCRAGAA